MTNLKRYLGEEFGTMLLVIFGCGSAILSNGNTLITALSFGLTYICVFSIFSKISPCHLNPAVTLAFSLRKELSIIDTLMTILAQIIGGIIGALLLSLIFRNNTYLFANMMQTTILKKVGITFEKDYISYVIAILSEILFSFIFVLTFLVESKNKKLNAYAISFTLALIYLLEIGLTGGSINPARSLGVAIFQGGEALKEVWIFTVSPLIGGIIATLISKSVKVD